jgi:integrase
MLNDTKLRSLKSRDEPYSISDGNGLYIEIRPTGAKYWRQNYRYNGKQKKLAHGKYPLVSLAEAREMRDQALKELHSGSDPSKLKRQAKLRLKNTFGQIAKEWHDKESENWKAIHSYKVWRQLERDVLPYLQDEPIDRITTTDLLDVLKRVEKRGALDIASRQRQRCEAIFNHAILTDRAINNPAVPLVKVLKTKKVKHRNALNKNELPEFLSRLELFDCHSIPKIALKVLIHTFVRTGELRGATWPEFDLENKVWLIPGERMKMGADHIVPLTPQVIGLLNQIKHLTGNRTYVFASPQRPKQPISNNTILQIIYRMGYKGRATGHGFRATASSTLNELGFNPDAIERQLAHSERNKVRAAYNRSEYLDERKSLMATWSEIVDQSLQTLCAKES